MAASSSRAARFSRLIVQCPRPAKDNDAAKVRRVLLGDNLILIDHAEGHLVVAVDDGVQLVTGFGAVKKELAILIDVSSGALRKGSRGLTARTRAVWRCNTAMDCCTSDKS